MLWTYCVQIAQERWVYTPIHQAFTVFGPLLMVLQLHYHWTSDSCNQYMNSTLKNTYCLAFYMHPKYDWMWTPDLDTLDTTVSLWVHCSNGMIGFVYSRSSQFCSQPKFCTKNKWNTTNKCYMDFIWRVKFNKTIRYQKLWISVIHILYIWGGGTYIHSCVVICKQVPTNPTLITDIFNVKLWPLITDIHSKRLSFWLVIYKYTPFSYRSGTHHH